MFALHAAAFAALALDLRSPTSMNGGAPVIQLTLAPRASFDGLNAPAPAAASTTPSRHANDAHSRPASETAAPSSEPPLIHSPSPLLLDAVSSVAKDPAPPTLLAQSPKASSLWTDRSGEASRPSEAGLTQGGGALVAGAAAASTPDAYEAVVLAWIERHKQHPGGPSGVVTVRFTLDRRGVLRASEVLAGSGVSNMDYAALSQLKDAAPFPRPPSNTPWRTRDFVVHMDFRSAGGPG